MPSATALARKVSAIDCAVSRSVAAFNADWKSGSVIGGRSISERSALNLARPQAVSADSPTLRPIIRTTITTAAAAPRESGSAWSTTADVVGATVSPIPPPSSASCRASTGYGVSPPQVSPIRV